MIEVNHSCRVFLNKKGQVVIRVRWNTRKCEVGFSIGCNADPDKWDGENQRARYNTTHKVGGRTIIARDINNRITQFLDCIKESFTEYGVRSETPSTSELKELVNEKLGRVKEEVPLVVEEVHEKSLRNAFYEFMKLRPSENNWGDKTHFKYNQMWEHLNSFDSAISLESLDKRRLNSLKEWYIANGYHNATITKHFRNLKGVLKWADSNGYPVRKDLFSYKTNLAVPPKVVTFLRYKELLHFVSFDFPVNKDYLDRARDLFCFMAFTSLRYSDLKALKKASISEEYIEIYTQKTRDKVRIPIVSYAHEILDKYKDYQGNYVFPVPSNQKLNDYLKEAAELAGLDREVVETYFIGTERHEEIHKFYETISCHDGRRTFVCCSLALGISPTVVMSCTGHSDYESMRPYIEVADETQKMQMDKWNTHQYKSEIIDCLDKVGVAKLKEVLKVLKDIA